MENKTNINSVEQSNYSSRTKKENKNNKMYNKAIIIALSIGAWIGIVYFGYTYVQGYIDKSIQNVQQQNAVNIQGLREEVQILSSEIRNIRNSMESAGLTISNTSEVQERIEVRLHALDTQLQELQKSLKILKEAPNAKN